MNFWSPLCTIDTNLWFRWFHTDKIILILDHDTYLPRNLLSPSANHRFATVQCRIAASKLFHYLKTWSSFVLLENQSFIRFLPTGGSPLYFSLVRVAQKHPCVVLHVGYIEGTPHSLQSETLRELQEALLGLSVERVPPSKRSRGAGSTRGKAAKPCAFLIQKQLQRVMIRCAVCMCIHRLLVVLIAIVLILKAGIYIRHAVFLLLTSQVTCRSMYGAIECYSMYLTT